MHYALSGNTVLPYSILWHCSRVAISNSNLPTLFPISLLLHFFYGINVCPHSWKNRSFSVINSEHHKKKKKKISWGSNLNKWTLSYRFFISIVRSRIHYFFENDTQFKRFLSIYIWMISLLLDYIQWQNFVWF